MAMRFTSSEGVQAMTIEALGFDSAALDLTSVEAMACSLRRTAALLCPCSGRTLLSALLQSFEHLVDTSELHKPLEQTLEALVAHGDLVEVKDASQEETPGVLLHIGRPSFTCRSSGAAILIGVAPDGLSPLPDFLEGQVDYINHLRLLPASAAPELAEQLRELGLSELKLDKWLKPPARSTAEEFLGGVDELLDKAGRSGDITNLEVLDPTTKVTYYPKRWVPLKNQTGRFVARRPQAYGADLWCYLEVKSGQPMRFVDLPLCLGSMRGCDEAWRLQAAIDHLRGAPQLFQVRPGPSDTRVLRFFSPVPMWACRRWDALGEPTSSESCLFAYKLPEAEIAEEVSFLKQCLWLAERP